MGIDLTKGNPLTVILRFTLPLFIGNVFQQLYNMADTIIVGHFVGQDALAAVGSTGTIMFLVLGFSMGLTSGFAVLTSQRYGARDPKGVKISVANGILLSVILIIALTAVSLLSMKPLLRLMNTPEAIFQDAYTYISIICMGIVCSVFYNLFSALLRAIGNSRVPLYFLVFSACLNVVLDLVLIIAGHLGVAGAAIATDISQGISAFLCMIYIWKKVRELVPEKNMWTIHPQATAAQLNVGLPMALQFAITASGTVIMQAAINLFGATAVAAYTAANKLQNVITQGMLSMGETMASYGGQNYGKGDAQRIRKGVRAALMAEVVYSLFSMAVVWCLLRPALGLFFASDVNIDDMLPWAGVYLHTCSFFYIPLSMIFIFRNIMQGCGYGFLPMMGGVVEFFCRLLMAALAMHFMIYRLAAFCDPFAWLGAGLFTAVAYRYVIRRVEKTLGGSYTDTDAQTA
ncbi:MAG: MATE family efflux transporter [Lachnospiraceae bacterium]|nr:MATE family efflux transporter [Lachnospiraceae bacterium]